MTEELFDIDKIEEIYTEFLSSMIAKGYTKTLQGYIYIFAATEMISLLIQKKLVDLGVTHEQIASLRKTSEKVGLDMIAQAKGQYVSKDDGEA